MDIAIINCEKFDEDLEQRFGHHPGMFIQQFLTQQADATFTIYQASEMQLPPVCGYDGYLITGSHHDVHDPVEWIWSLENWLQKAHQLALPVVAICFAHQLIAHTLGGTVSESPKGWKLGLAKNQLQHAPSWVHCRQQQFDLLVSHHCQVEQLPRGAQRLAGSPNCPNFMYQIGEHFFAIQGHPEFNRQYAEYLLEQHQQDLEPSRYQKALSSLQQPTDSYLVFTWILDFYRHHQEGGNADLCD